MALATQAPTTPWPRWQDHPGDYSMIQTSGIMYDARTVTAGPLQRPVMASHYVMTPYTTAQVSPLAAPQYQPQSSYAYSPCYSPSPVSVSPPFRPDEQERLQTTPIEVTERDINNATGDHSRVPLKRSSSQASIVQSPTGNPNAGAKDISLNKTIDPAHQVVFDTDVDALMKTIQGAKEDTVDAGQSSLMTPAASPKPDVVTRPQKARKYVCDGPGCTKSFVQKTHLDIHRRTHTGLRPYVCEIGNCGLTFSQRGNLKTHMRRHTGERPYRCGTCGKSFAQRGNVRSHEKTHSGLKLFHCKLDDCTKSFSQLGNMKTHQNNFHKETLLKLTKMFTKFSETGGVPQQYQELFEYFKDHYKNSNKGIKGRGKARKVPLINSEATLPPVSDPTTVSLEVKFPAQQLPCISQVMPSPEQMPAYPVTSGPPSMLQCMPRTIHGYDHFHGDMSPQGHASPVLYSHSQ